MHSVMNFIRNNNLVMGFAILLFFYIITKCLQYLTNKFANVMNNKRNNRKNNEKYTNKESFLERQLKNKAENFKNKRGNRGK